jgi:hypothetical protein
VSATLLLGTLFCMAWGERRKHVIVGGNSVVHIYKLHKVSTRVGGADDMGSAANDEKSKVGGAVQAEYTVGPHT